MSIKQQTVNHLSFCHTKALAGIICGILVVLSFAFATVSTGSEIKEALFRDSVRIGNDILNMRGMGQLRWLLFKVYTAALYLPDDIPSKDVLEDVPKRMEFHYFVDITAEEFSEAAAPYLAKNVPPDQLAKISPKVDAINQLYRDVSKGDRYTLTYRPGQGTELALNGDVLGEIPGFDFAAAYYRIWLGDDPLDEDLKRALLNTTETDSS
jgi:hypothetical protein